MKETYLTDGAFLQSRPHLFLPQNVPKLYRECFRRGCHPVRYREASNPIISFDTKKKEVLGNLYRPGTLYTKEPVTTLDHVFWSLGHRKVMTHGVYSSQQSRGYMTLKNSKDTREIACEALKRWWNNYGKVTYPNANSILAKCDDGGSNNANHYIFKEDLQKLLNEIAGLKQKIR